MVLEVNLHDLVAQSEHDSVPRSHPLLDVDRASRGFVRILQIIGCVSKTNLHLCMLVTGALLSRARLQIALKVL